MAAGNRTGRVALAILATMSLAACRDVGLGGNVPLEEAENRQFRYSVYEMTEAAGHGANVLSFDNRSWMANATTTPIPERLLRVVGSADGVELFAPVWAEAPHVQLFTRAGAGTWHPVTPTL